MAGVFNFRKRFVIRIRLSRAFNGQMDKNSVARIRIGMLQRFAVDRNYRHAVLSGRFGDKLFKPSARSSISGDAMIVSLSLPFF